MGFAPVSKGLQAYPRCRVPAAPLAGALLISISAVSVSCCAHLSAPDVWQLSFLGATASIPSHAGNARLLSTSLSSGTAGVFEGDVWWTARESNPVLCWISRTVDQTIHPLRHPGATRSDAEAINRFP